LFIFNDILENCTLELASFNYQNHKMVNESHSVVLHSYGGYYCYSLRAQKYSKIKYHVKYFSTTIANL